MSNSSLGNSLYITLQYLRTVDGQNKYHWALYISGNAPPSGFLYHATDANRAALDLYLESRKVTNPLRSKSMVVCLRVASSPGMQTMDSCAAAVRLMDPRYLPRGERQWTCRVWVKEVLKILMNNRFIQLPASIDNIEQYCQITGDNFLEYMGRARVFNDLTWMSSRPRNRSQPASRTTPMDIDYTGSSPRYYGSKPMAVDSKAYYGPKPMVTDPTGYYGSKPMITETHRSSRYP